MQRPYIFGSIPTIRVNIWKALFTAIVNLGNKYYLCVKLSVIALWLYHLSQIYRNVLCPPSKRFKTKKG